MRSGSVCVVWWRLRGVCFRLDSRVDLTCLYFEVVRVRSMGFVLDLGFWVLALVSV